MELAFHGVKLALVFAFLLLGSKRLGIGFALALGVLSFGLLSGMGPVSFGRIIAQVSADTAFWRLTSMVFCLVVFADVFVATGHCDRMVKSLEAYITSPLGRLTVYPVMLGLLPMPGGAILSCPMVKSSARHIDGLNEQRMATINYWFRHILEAVWPFYPGFIMVCALAEVSAVDLPRYVWPLTVSSALGGWLFLLRGIRLAPDAPKGQDKSLAEVLHGALPLLITLAVTALCLAAGKLLGMPLLEHYAFAFGPISGIVANVVDGRHSPLLVLRCMLTPKVGQTMLILVVIFLFNRILETSGFIEAVLNFTRGTSMLPLLFMVVPFISALATGLYFGFVALSFPLLMPLLQASPELWDNRLAYVALAVFFGQAGQMLSPAHACLVFSCGYFDVHVGKVWQKLLAPVLLNVLVGLVVFALIV